MTTLSWNPMGDNNPVIARPKGVRKTIVTEWHKDLMEADMQFRKQMAVLEQLRLQMADAELKASELRREITRLLDARVKQEVGQ